MHSRPRLIAVVCSVLLLTAGCTNSQKSEIAHTSMPENVTATNSTSGDTAAGDPKIERPSGKQTLEQARDRYKAQYRLKPDRQFLLAIAYIHHFLTQQEVQEVATNFSDKYWHLRYAGME